jgi:hypothetical protein
MINEKNVPTNPTLWKKYVDQAKKKFDVYPSAYANGWASKQYKDAGGKWKTESVEEPQHVAAGLPQTKELKGKKIGERFLEYLRDNGLNHAAYQNEAGEVKIVGLNKDQVKEALGNLVKEWNSKTESVNEGAYEKIMQAIKKGMDGKTLTVMAIDTQTKKVVYQKDIPTIQKDLVPAYYKEIRAKYPSPRYVFAIENGTGKIIYKEGFSGGAGVGVSLPGGYINGAPKSKDVKKMKKNLR